MQKIRCVVDVRIYGVINPEISLSRKYCHLWARGYSLAWSQRARVTFYKWEPLTLQQELEPWETLLLAEMLPKEKMMGFRVNKLKTNKSLNLELWKWIGRSLGGMIAEIRMKRQFSIWIHIMFIQAIVNWISY